MISNVMMINNDGELLIRRLFLQSVVMSLSLEVLKIFLIKLEVTVVNLKVSVRLVLKDMFFLICCAFGITEPLKFSETDSDSIETISDDECLISHPLANSSHAFCYIPGRQGHH